MFEKYASRFSEADIAKFILKYGLSRIEDYIKADVVIVGAGPSGLTTAYETSKMGLKTIVLERTLGIGGGIRGGGMLIPSAIVEGDEAIKFFKDIGVKLNRIDEDLYEVNPVEAMLKIAVKAIDQGVLIWPGIIVEDVIISEEGNSIRVRGVMINWTTIFEAGWHVDPLMIESKAVVDATGHDADVIKIVSRRFPKLKIEVPGMSSMNIWMGEEQVVMRSGRVLKGLYLAGMAVAELYNTYRMGPVLGGMISSGLKVAREIIKDLKGM